MKSTRKKKFWNERTRLLLTLELVVIPAAALIVLSVVHLRSIQRDRAVEAAIQRDFQHMLKLSEKRISDRGYEMVDDVVHEFPTDSSDIKASFDKIMAAHPYAGHMFVYAPNQDLIWRSNPTHCAYDSSFRKEGEWLANSASTWLPLEFKGLLKDLEKMGKRGGRPYSLFNIDAPGGDHYLYNLFALFPVKLDDEEAIGGFVFDRDYLQTKFFPEMFEVLVPATPAGTQDPVEHNAVMMVHQNKEMHPMATSAEWDGGEPEVERTMDTVFRGLTLGIKYRGTTVAAMGQKFLRTSFLILGGLSLLLMGGIFLVYRSVTKEMALAKLKSDFVSNVSHELRTPLSLIRLYAETLELGRVAAAEKCHEYYTIIRKESERLTGLINNILDFSRIEAGRKEYEFRETDLPELVRNTLDSYRYQIEQNGFTYKENIAENIPPVEVDREAIARSLLNLVNNAVKYSSDDKYLCVNLYRDNGSVKLEVVDHGIGIPRTEQHKIFEKFYRVGDPLVHNTKGSGLGLSLVRHIAHAHGGDVAVESAPGRGSKFTLVLPISPEKRTVSAVAS
jgi:signal transduction histidine kinase